MYEYQEFPRWKYHAVEPAVIVENKEAETALGKGWFNSPADVSPAASDADPVLDDSVVKKPVKKVKA